MSLLDKEPVKRAEKFLKSFDQSLEVIILEDSARTAQDAAKALDCNVGAIVKSLLFRAGDDFILCLVAGDKRCSLNKLKKFKDKNIIVSGSDKEGEGEFKIFNFIRNENIELNHIIYGLDADLIMLSLINYPYKIFLYRETKYFLYFKHINKDKKYLLNTTMLAEQISIGLYNNIFNIKRAVNQYCFLSFLCGNDFLPHSPFINIRNGGLETIFSNFKIIKNDIVSNDKIIWSTLKQLFINLSIKEDELLNKHIAVSYTHLTLPTIYSV